MTTSRTTQNTTGRTTSMTGRTESMTMTSRPSGHASRPVGRRGTGPRDFRGVLIGPWSDDVKRVNALLRR